MPLGTAATLNAEHMKSGSHALDIFDLSFLGDTSYPAGGSINFQAFVRTAVGRDVTVAAVVGMGLNGGYHLIYDPDDDKLICEVKATGVDTAGSVALNGVTFRCLVICY